MLWFSVPSVGSVPGIRIWFHRHTFVVFPPLSVPACRVWLSAAVLMDLSVVGLQHVPQSRMSLAMICISLEPWDEGVRLVERCKGAFHHVNHLWFCVLMLDSWDCACKQANMTKHPLISRLNKNWIFFSTFFATIKWFLIIWINYHQLSLADTHFSYLISVLPFSLFGFFILVVNLFNYFLPIILLPLSQNETLLTASCLLHF